MTGKCCRCEEPRLPNDAYCRLHRNRASKQRRIRLQAEVEQLRAENERLRTIVCRQTLDMGHSISAGSVNVRNQMSVELK